ncbi:MAG: hypothetical protein K9G67_15450 [Bacteroidales bacterium]|nr:hypothetical protein [Bacteroidales bacterium]MCF8344039.1 hypothetical protein [Bacteroidales bacterium]MCF8351588.1 hypothetical protein [Bacteroidales bacterium]MCF8377751.1 hypothetical protein [Bacteroidales bacterium]
MRKRILKLLFVFGFLLMSCGLMAQTGPPLPPGHGETTDQGGSAPIGGGVFILLGLGGLYAGKKVYDIRKKKLLD